MVPHEFFEVLLRRLKGPAVSVACYLLRRTYGWEKGGEAISLAEFMEHTGLSKEGVLSGLRKLQAEGIIEVVRRRTEKGDALPTYYRFVHATRDTSDRGGCPGH